MSQVDTLSTEELEFIKAVIQDDVYELEFGDEYILFTDHEGDGYFLPSVTILYTVDEDDRETVKQEISDIITEEFSWLEFEGISHIQDDNTGNVSHLYFDYPQINESVLSEVTEMV